MSAIVGNGPIVVYYSKGFILISSCLQDYLSDITSDPVKSKLCKQRVLCRTLAGNLVYVLTITSPTKTPEEMKVCNEDSIVINRGIVPDRSMPSSKMMAYTNAKTLANHVYRHLG